MDHDFAIAPRDYQLADDAPRSSVWVPVGDKEHYGATPGDLAELALVNGYRDRKPSGR